jgi:hypothetical protein
MKRIHLIVLFTLVGSFIMETYSQGCSDAGFCSISSLKTAHPDSLDFTYKNQFKLGGSIGKADHKIDVYSGYLEFSKNVDSCSSVEVKLSYITQRNSQTTSSGLSDLYLIGNWHIAKNLFFTSGFKMALTDGNDEIDGQILPMDFQHSLGTIDLILGFRYDIKGFQLYLAGQQPLNKSKNTFVTPNSGNYVDYQTTNKYKRKGDLLFRASYPIAAGSKITITPSLLPIYHIADDEYTDISGEQVFIKNSKGLTLNGNLFVDFELNRMNKITLSFAAPFVTRKVRPDGLTRKYVVGLEYGIRF